MRLLSLFSFLTLATTTLGSTLPLVPRADPGAPCKQDSNCYGGAKCCALGFGSNGGKVCKLGDCNGVPNPGDGCVNNGYCFGGAQCCNLVCKLGSCRMNGSCDADNDCYGWCHNNPGKCVLAWGKTEGTCTC